MVTRKRTDKGIFRQEQDLLGVRVSARVKQALEDMATQEEFIRDMEDSETPASIKKPPYQ